MTNKPNLYAVLGFNIDSADPRRVPADKIKAAYRLRVKETHPDHGGDPEEFRLVQLAYEVLSDPERRERYDRTGEYDDTVAANVDGEALSIVELALAHVIEDGRVDIDTTDIMQPILAVIERSDNQAAMAIDNHQRTAKRLSRMIERISRKDGGESAIAGMLRHRLKGELAGIDSATKARATFVRAREIVRAHDYRVDGAQQDRYAGQRLSDRLGLSSG